MLAFSLVGFASLYALQRLQNVLPLNPQGFDPVPVDLAFNTSVSFVTNTNWRDKAPKWGQICKKMYEQPLYAPPLRKSLLPLAPPRTRKNSF
jgi:hypothetical protein